MKKIKVPAKWLGLTLFAVFFLMSCRTDSKHNQKRIPEKVKQNFSVKINGTLWEAKPAELSDAYRISYGPLSRQLTIAAEAVNGSRIAVSFHSIDKIVPGSYPSTENDNGVKSGIFYYPRAKGEDKEMASVTFDIPVQENTVRILKIDKIGQETFLIEGEFSAMMYVPGSGSPGPHARFTEGEFRVIYSAEVANPFF